jgi:RimJ/RimL family protein N-acetyltransferase
MENAAAGGGSGMNSHAFQGKKVRLLSFDADRDAEILARWGQDSEYQQLQGSGPSSLWSAKQFKDWAEKHYAEMYSFTICTFPEDAVSQTDRVTNSDRGIKSDCGSSANCIIGSVDLGGIDWVSGNAWVGIGIGEREYWGKGYGSDAMNVLLDFAFGSLNLKRISLTVFEYNERAIKSYLKVGFREEGRMRQWMQRAGERYDLIFMGILREEWEERQQLAPAVESEPRTSTFFDEDRNEQQAA